MSALVLKYNSRTKQEEEQTCLSMNSLVSFSMCPSYKLVVMFIRPIFDRPKSVSLMCPMEVINKLHTEKAERLHDTSELMFLDSEKNLE